METCFFCTGHLKEQHTAISFYNNKPIYLHSNYCYNMYSQFHTTAQELRRKGVLR